MKIAVLTERADGERRVAATPETVRKLIALGATVAVEAGAGLQASFDDAGYAAAGATVADRSAVLAGAGFYLGSRFSELDRYVGPVGIVLTVLALGYYVYRVVTWSPRAE